MPLLKIKPYDNTFFREGSNFELGISRLIQSKNIAYPSTFFGAIFTAILAKNHAFRKEFFSRKNNTDHLQILEMGQVYLYNENQNLTYIPAPKDIFVNKKIVFGDFVENKENMSSISYQYYLQEPKGCALERADKYFVQIHRFSNKYLPRTIKMRDLKHEEDIFIKNKKTGIAMDTAKGRTKDSLLYTIEQTEFRDTREDNWSYIVNYKINKQFVQEQGYPNIEDLKQGELKLGGESKICKYQTVENEDIEVFEKGRYLDKVVAKEKIILVFTSDAYFEKPLEEIFEETMSVQALVNDKPIYISGFDMATRKRKKTYKGYPAGTILLLGSRKDIEKNALEEILKEKQQNGFNQCFYIKEDGKRCK